MQTAKIFPNGGSQAVRLPKNLRFKSDEVYVKDMGGIVVLIPKDDPWGGFFSSMGSIPELKREKRKPKKNRKVVF
ncbi:MAG: AbrB/MazE/SpoVT family DNA-binding domain-containing protein [Bacteroidota bacterium]|nr:AbrB/MazE/SpoVT family DNA-binding domain-containing protein [Bacteroidota bacterium]